MKLILTHEVDGLGSPGDIVEVKDGYGRNYLVPRGMALVWSRGRREADRVDQARPGRPVDRRILATRKRSRVRSKASTSPSRSARATPAACSVQ